MDFRATSARRAPPGFHRYGPPRDGAPRRHRARAGDRSGTRHRASTMQDAPRTATAHSARLRPSTVAGDRRPAADQRRSKGRPHAATADNVRAPPRDSDAGVPGAHVVFRTDFEEADVRQGPNDQPVVLGLEADARASRYGAAGRGKRCRNHGRTVLAWAGPASARSRSRQSDQALGVRLPGPFGVGIEVQLPFGTSLNALPCQSNCAGSSACGARPRRNNRCGL